MKAALTPDAAEAILGPKPSLEVRIRALLEGELGRVLPPNSDRGLDWYYRRVVLGGRALEAYEVLSHSRLPAGRVVDAGSGLGSFVLLANRLGMPAIGGEPGGEVELARERAEAISLRGDELFLSGAEGRLSLYLVARGRDFSYFDHHLFYLRRGPVLRQFRGLGFELSFPRRSKLADPDAINRRWARSPVRVARGAGRALWPAAELAAENPVQSVVDVVGTKPS
jgi:hypothetical protein